ncbi:AraC family transcriptional regulator [Microbacterium sp. NPDC089696]|uniref:helix-turn-helix transcriptional regulator n=1 Tax=Microbacterium sp. NPDC089696 TaxID=3364199 RepID=UPI0037FD2AF5
MSTATAIPIDEAQALSGYRLYQGPQLESAQRSLAKLYSPQTERAGEIVPVGHHPRHRGISSVSGVRMTHLTLANIRLGEQSQLRIAAQNAYHLAVPLSGEIGCYFGSRKVQMTPGMVAVTAPQDPVLIPSWGTDAAVLCLQIHPGVLESELSRLLGRPVGMPMIASDIDLESPAGRSWVATLGLLLRELSTADSLLATQRGYGEDLQRLLIAAFLRATEHQYSSELANEVAPPRWRSVKRAIEAIDRAPERAWTLAELALIAEVGSRRLQQGFSAQVGMSPMAYLHAVRFDRVRNDLLTGVDAIGDTAMKWGFTHLGRFSVGYRRRFGESPRETQQHIRAHPQRTT